MERFLNIIALIILCGVGYIVWPILLAFAMVLVPVLIIGWSVCRVGEWFY